MQKTTSIAICGAVLVTTLGFTGPAQADTLGDIPPIKTLEPLLGTNPAQDSFVQLANKAEADHPDTYAAAEWLGSASTGGWISFTGEPPRDVYEAAAALDFPVELRSGAPTSRAEAQELLLDMNDVAIATGLEKYSIATSTDLSEITVSVPPGASHDALAIAGPLINESRSATFDSTQTHSIHVKIEYTSTAGLDEQARVQGGGPMTDSSGDPTCTAGFAARRGDQKGILTAGHCPDSDLNTARNPYPWTTIQEHQGTYGDGQFMSNADPSPELISSVQAGASVNTAYNVGSTGEAVVGSTIFNVGRTRYGSNDAKVEAVNVCIDTKCSLVRTNGDFTNNGDSGGPWIDGSRAVGIHAGVQSGKAIFSRVQRLMAVLSTEVYTG